MDVVVFAGYRRSSSARRAATKRSVSVRTAAARDVCIVGVANLAYVLKSVSVQPVCTKEKGLSD